MRDAQQGDCSCGKRHAPSTASPDAAWFKRRRLMESLPGIDWPPHIPTTFIVDPTRPAHHVYGIDPARFAARPVARAPPEPDVPTPANIMGAPPVYQFGAHEQWWNGIHHADLRPGSRAQTVPQPWRGVGPDLATLADLLADDAP